MDDQKIMETYWKLTRYRTNDLIWNNGKKSSSYQINAKQFSKGFVIKILHLSINTMNYGMDI